MTSEKWEGLPAGLEVTTEAKKEYLNVILDGEFQFSRAEEIATRIMAYCHQMKMKKILVDARHTRGKIPLLTKIEFGDTMADRQLEHMSQGKEPLKIAHVVPEGMAEPGKFGELFAANRGIAILVTTSLDEAVQWLGVKE
jgi:hypothetical protein